jgi:hypothetical protein
MPGKSLRKNHLTELPLTSERMRSSARSLAHVVYINVEEEHMPRRREIPDHDM